MKTSVRLRRAFTPLTIGSKLVCVSPDSGLSQTYYSKEEMYVPNRATSPLRIAPIVIASADDNSWEGTMGNHYLGDTFWYLDGEQITIDGVNYKIVDDEEYKYVLECYVNFPAGESHTIFMSSTMYDYRTGENIPVKTDAITVSTDSFSVGQYRIEFGGSQNILYNPLKDTLLDYEYRTAQGEELGEHVPGKNDYLYTDTIDVYVGNEKMNPSDYEVKIFDSKTGTELIAGEELLVSATGGEITLDLRCADEERLDVAIYVNGKEAVRQSLCSITRERDVYLVKMINEEDIYPRAVTHWDKAIIQYDGEELKSGENVIDMTWYADSYRKKDNVVGYGKSVIYNIIDTGISETAINGYIEQYIDHKHKKAYESCLDENQEVLTNEIGEPLIFN